MQTYNNINISNTFANPIVYLQRCLLSTQTLVQNTENTIQENGLSQKKRAVPNCKDNKATFAVETTLKTLLYLCIFQHNVET